MPNEAPARFSSFRLLSEAKAVAGPAMVLMFLLNKSGEGWGTAEIAEAIGMSVTTVSMAKKKLTEKNLVIERFPYRDQRTVRLYLTPLGRIEAKKLWDAIDALSGARQAHFRCPRPD